MAVAAPAVAGAAAVPGLNALLLPLLLSFGPAGLAKLFGGQTPEEKLRRQVQNLLTPENIRALTEKFYRDALQSPAYSQGQAAIATGANQAANNIGASLAARGIGTTGTGAVLSGLTPSLIGSQTAGLRTAAHTAAGQQATETLKAQIANLTGTSAPSQSTQLFAGGLESFQPYLQAYLRSKYPQMTWAPAAAR